MEIPSETPTVKKDDRRHTRPMLLYSKFPNWCLLWMKRRVRRLVKTNILAACT